MLWKGRILMFVLPFKKGSYQIFACHWKYFLKDGNVQVCALFYMVRSWCFRYSTMKWGFGQLDGLVVDLLFSKAIVLFSPQGNGEEEGNFRPIPVFTVWSSFWDGASSSSALLVVTALDLTIFPWISSSFLQHPLILKRKERTGSQDAQGSLPSFHVDKSPTKISSATRSRQSRGLSWGHLQYASRSSPGYWRVPSSMCEFCFNAE